MRILGVDPGTATTGYGLIDEDQQGQFDVIGYGVIKTQAGLPDEQRLMTIHQQLKDIILLHHPDCAGVEKLFFQNNAKTAIVVGQARGVILLTLAQAGLKIDEFTPMEVKQAVTGYGNADKKQIQQMVQMILHLDAIPTPDDAADALAIAICVANSARWKEQTV
jgi:crossover junction endodeoxyribonuclease RuvC